MVSWEEQLTVGVVVVVRSQARKVVWEETPMVPDTAHHR